MLKRNLMKICVPLAIIAALAGVMPVVPALAASTPNIARPPLHTIQGKVTQAPVGPVFYIQSGNNTAPIAVSTNTSTKFYLISIGRVENYVDNQVNKDLRQDKVKESPGTAMKELHIPANWRDDLGWLDTFDKVSSLADVGLGDRIIARVDAGGMAWQVLIIKAPVIKQVKGQIDSISGNVITINNVPLIWDANTRFTLKGLIAVAPLQYATAVYSSSTTPGKAITVNVLPTPPGP